MYAHNRMMKAVDSEKLTYAFIEGQIVEVMPRMTHTNR